MTDRSIARFQFSTEDALSFVLKFTGISLAGRTLRVRVKDRSSSTTRATLTIGAGLTVTGTDQVSAAVATADMVTWPRGEYSADLVDITGAPSTIMAVRFVFDLPGNLVYGASDRVAYVTWGENKAYVTATGAVGPAGPTGPQGEGWSPVLAISNDGARRVQRVVDWTGGTGDKPATGLYVGAVGLVSDIANGVDIRGSQGAQGIQGNVGNTGAPGDKGWSPATAIVSDGVRRVLQVVDWVGGAGTKPGTGYVGATGMVPNIADGIDIRGLQGPAGSVVDGDKGDITVSGSGTAWTIDAGVVDFTKFRSIGTSRLLGRSAAGFGSVEEISPSVARSILQVTAQGETLILATDAATQRAAMSVAAQVAPKTGAYAVIAGDYGRIFAVTGTWTFGTLAAATAGTDFWFEIRNEGSGVITIDPNAAETINGAATLKIYRGETVKVVSDGTVWRALFLSGFALLDAASPIGANVSAVDLALPSEFRSFEVHLEGFEPTVSAALGMRFSTDGGATFYLGSGNYQWAQAYTSGSTTYAQSYSSGGSSVFGSTGIEVSSGTVSAAAGSAVGADIQIRPGRTSWYPSVQFQFHAPGYSNFGGGYLAVAQRITHARLVYGGSAQISSGSIFELRGRR